MRMERHRSSHRPPLQAGRCHRAWPRHNCNQSPSCRRVRPALTPATCCRPLPPRADHRAAARAAATLIPGAPRAAGCAAPAALGRPLHGSPAASRPACPATLCPRPLVQSGRCVACGGHHGPAEAMPCRPAWPQGHAESGPRLHARCRGAPQPRQWTHVRRTAAAWEKTSALRWRWEFGTGRQGCVCARSMSCPRGNSSHLRAPARRPTTHDGHALLSICTAGTPAGG